MQYAPNPAAPQIRPAFIVEKCPEGATYKKMYVKKTEKGLQQEVREEPMGYMVSFPKYGNKIHIATYEQLERLGFNRAVPLVNEAEGDVVGSIPNAITKPVEAKKA